MMPCCTKTLESSDTTCANPCSGAPANLGRSAARVMLLYELRKLRRHRIKKAETAATKLKLISVVVAGTLLMIASPTSRDIGYYMT